MDLSLLALLIPCLLLGTVPLVPDGADPLRAPARTAALAFGVAVAVVLGLAAVGPGVGWGLRVDAVSAVMLLLVTAVGAVVARYSRRYLAGDPRAPRYARALLFTLASVTTLVASEHLALLAVAWTATSVGLHQLLTHRADRPQALVAAHKKFLASRVADLCLWGALALIGAEAGGLELTRVLAYLRDAESGPRLELAGLLVVAAAALKSAQLPFHGWITQVMEAPTPVSALLHAGIVNLGGFLVIRLAPLLDVASVASLALVLIGTVTTVVAALVTATRVSVKVQLAWSTSAQLGMMLVQAGLGAPHLALLHLVAHSLYKAHAFLSAGGVVDQHRIRALSAPPPPPGPRALALAAAAVVAGGAGALALVDAAGAPPLPPAAWVLASVLGLALVPQLARGSGLPRAALPGLVLRGAGVVVATLLAHGLASVILPPAAPTALGPARAFAPVLAGGGFLLLAAAEVLLLAEPRGKLATRLHPLLFAGLHLDEWFTRLTFQIWPPRMPEGSSGAVVLPSPQEA